MGMTLFETWRPHLVDGHPIHESLFSYYRIGEHP